ncbi:MAG: DegT/DnrJ/EryC1/StrS family aminotransferase, partial [Rhodospirillaceae bacterium]
DYPELNPDFIFAFPAYNTRNNEIGGVLGRSQLKRLDQIIKSRSLNLERFLNQIDSKRYRTNFKLDGSSNYAFNLILKEPNDTLAKNLQTRMRENGIEFRRGSAGGGNQLRQPYLQSFIPKNYHQQFPEVEHVHFYGYYIGNFPDLRSGEIDEICEIINSV